MPDIAERQAADRRQAMIGLGLAALIIIAWATLHVYAVFFVDLAAEPWWLVAGIVLMQTWLYVGLFIVAHDCMHGSLVPFRPDINRAVGQLCLALYAGFSFDALNRKHHRHHRHSGTPDDPDFDDHPPEYGFWHWYYGFFTEYFGPREFLIIAAQSAVYLFVLGASIWNVLVFWALPALLSSAQLFVFGTWLPHRPGSDGFADHHRARTNDYGWLLSLFTCFHFGYHHEHHLEPGAPWWRLPKVHRERGAGR
jgi:beta-carotene ketolase (CrtW type)